MTIATVRCFVNDKRTPLFSIRRKHREKHVYCATCPISCLFCFVCLRIRIDQRLIRQVPGELHEVRDVEVIVLRHADKNVELDPRRQISLLSLGRNIAGANDTPNGAAPPQPLLGLRSLETTELMERRQ